MSEFNKSNLVHRTPPLISSEVRRSCPWCEDVDDAKMVECKICNCSYHIKCLRKTPDPTRKFSCDDCRKKALAAKARAIQATKTQSDPSSFPVVDQSDKALPGAINLATAKQIPTSSKTKEGVDTEIDDIQPIIDNVDNAGSTTGRNRMGKTAANSKTGSQSSRSTTALQLQLLKEKEELLIRQLDEKHQLQQQLQNERASILGSIKATSQRDYESSNSSRLTSLNRTREWVEDNEVAPSYPEERRVNFRRNDQQDEKEAPRARQSTPATSLASRTFLQFCNSVQGPQENHIKLTRSQIQSRQVLPKELPAFSGSPQDWPLFVSAFTNSSKRCGFTNEENLLRLQKALRGPALQAVRGKLMLPETVPEVMNMLRMLYGRPELILKSLVKQIRAEPAVKHDSLEQLIRFAMMVQNMCATIEASQLTEHMCNPMLVQDLVDKLPAHMKLDWAKHKRTRESPSLLDFNVWLFDLAEAASEVTSGAIDPVALNTKTARQLHHDEVKPEPQSDENKTEIQQIIAKKQQEAQTCVMCSSKHNLAECKKFLDLQVKRRWDIIIKHRLCSHCFGSHYYRRCTRKRECGVDGCPRNHHKLLHKPNSVGEGHRVSKEPTKRPLERVNTHVANAPYTLFRIIPVTLYGKKNVVNTYAFLDEGSSVSLMDDQLANELEIDGSYDSLCLRWTGGETRTEYESRRVTVEIAGIGKNSKRYRLSNIRTVANLDLPTQTVDVSKLQDDYQHLKDVPAHAYKDALPRILIGQPHWSLGLPLERYEGTLGEPIGSKCRLGWSVSGAVGGNTIEAVHFHVCECNHDQTLHQLVKSYFSLENFGVRKSEVRMESDDDRRARQILQETTKLVGKRYETGLLWRCNDIVFPESRDMAICRLLCLEKKMDRDLSLRENLRTQMADYVNKGYASELSNEMAEKITTRTWYLPIFTVVNPNKPEKIRMVWDAAAKVNGVSLNSMLLTGPDLLTPLPEVLYRFRERSVALCGDIKEMFHQVQIKREDRQSQRFLWRASTSEDIKTFEMNVMTFGSTCSPSAAQYVKNLNADRFTEHYSRAAHEIKTNHYVDDWLSSFNEAREALEVANQVKSIHLQAGFEIRNWLSNDSTITTSLSESSTKPQKNLNMNGTTIGSKVLGMWWETDSDSLYFSYNVLRMGRDIMNGSRRPTKREVLKCLMMIFDPLGLIANVLVYVKMLLQEIWRSSVEWDDNITEEQNKYWLQWIKVLPELATVRIPRCYGMCVSHSQKTDLHVFVDASERAYAAVAYFRAELQGEVRVALVSAKTKVAPQKPLSIPRLELQAAVLGTRLAATIERAHSIAINTRTFWSDSANVLSWIRSTQRKFVTFVAFRIGEVLEASEVAEWRYVPSKENVADEATKWMGIPDCNAGNRWYKGPPFLYIDPEYWPKDKCQHTNDNTMEEIRICAQKDIHHSTLSPDPTRVAHWRILLKSQAIVLRVIGNAKQGREKKYGPLTAEELQVAEEELYRTIQRDSYNSEIDSLKANPHGPVDKGSSLYRLSPFLDNKSILRMKGRMDNAAYLTYNAKNPVILPGNHPSVQLLLLSYHRRYHHHNYETVINEVKQVYWIPKVRVVMKTIRKRCQRCKNDKAKPVAPMMANHPNTRLAAFVRPFTYVGIDFFGPMEITVGRRREKRWGALFTCLTIRAIHIEISPSLSADSAIICVRNFIARRGVPNEIWSDNGTNFKGAANELKDELLKLDQKQLVEYFDRIQWRFITPAAPNMGGCWERLVRSVKESIIRTLPTRTPSEELLRACLMEAESIINSRPLTHIPVEPSASEALTPNHFLLGSSSGNKPAGIFTEDVLLLRKSWRKAQFIADAFWRRWLKEYLPTITRRTKWYHPVKPIDVGDIGMLWEDNIRSSWQMGKVIDVVKGIENQVRTVVVQTSKGTYTRPASKFAVLDVTNPGEQPTNPMQSTHGGEDVTDRRDVNFLVSTKNTI